MRLDDVPESENIEDRRGDGGGGGGFGLPMGMGGGGLGIGTIVVLGIIGYALGIDPRLLIGGAEIFSGGGQSYQQQPSKPGKTGAPSDDMGKFVARVLGSADVVWTQTFEQGGQRYRKPTLVMFSGATRADQCGMAQSAMGPFYCPSDQKIYLDTSFFRDLERRFRGRDAGPRLPRRRGGLARLPVRAVLCGRARGRPSRPESTRHSAEGAAAAAAGEQDRGQSPSGDRKSTRLNSSHVALSRMPSS